jgi:predicted Zn-dependent protease
MQATPHKSIHPLLQFLIMVALFLGLWLGFSQINWIGFLPEEEFSSQTEEKLGELLEEFMESTDQGFEHKEIREKLDSLIERIIESNRLELEPADVYLIESEEINAFALPGNKIIILSGLIEACNSEMELAGVLAHEMAHLELKHVRKKLIKQVGMTMITAALGGQGGNEIAGIIIDQLAGSAYDRSLEEEADLTAIRYLNNANLDPSGLAQFLENMDESIFSADYLEWISTHPNTPSRVAYLEKESAEYVPDIVPVLGKEGWEELKEHFQNN